MDEFRSQQPEIADIETTDFDVDRQLDEVLLGDWQERSSTESYEESSGSLSEIRALQEWRRETVSSQYGDFYRLFEAASAIDRQDLSKAQKSELRTALADKLILNSRRFSPQVADLYQALLAELDGAPYTPLLESTTAKVDELRESGDLNLLFSGDIPYTVKSNRIKTRLEGELKGRSALDRREKFRIQQEENGRQPSQSQTPPPARDESKPSMDEMERSKEGEMPPAIWSIEPAYGGYFKEQSFDSWDSASNIWRQSGYQFEIITYANLEQIDPDRDPISLRATILPGQSVRLPRPYAFDLTYDDPHKQLPYLIQQDQNGDAVISLPPEANEPMAVHMLLQQKEPNESPEQGTESTPNSLKFDLQELSQETIAKLQEIHKQRKGNLAKAKAIASYVMRRLKYSNDSSFNQLYDTDTNGYIAAIDNHRQADCDVANTYFAALCSALAIPARHVVGHMVKGKDNTGNSRITSGTGHAWSEIWDEDQNNWVRIDATPPGDPQFEDQEKSKGDNPPGDYGEHEAIGLTDEQLAELEEKLATLTEQLSYSTEEREIAEAAGVELKEARQIVKEIQAAEDTRLPNGKKVVDLLAQLFALIVESRKTSQLDYTGPLRQREGGEDIDDIVAHKIGIRAGETDPRSRQKPFEREQTEQVFGGFDVYIIGDKSGSMSETVDGEAKWQLQRRAQYLLLSPLHRFEQTLLRAKSQMRQQLSVRTESISFRDSTRIDVDKPLSDTFSATDKVKLWRSLGNQGVGNGDVAALTQIYEQIRTEHEGILKSGQEDDRLRIVIACSDGAPDSVSGVHILAERLGELNAVVVGLGLTETATAVPVIFNTPTSRGELVRDINHLPAVVAKHIIMEAIRLFPNQARKSAERIIEGILDKFKQID